VHTTKKLKQCLKVEKEEGSTKQHQVKEVKVVQYCIQLTIAKNEIFFKTAVTFLVYDSMFVNSCYTT